MDNEELLTRLRSKTIVDPITNCWLWQGSKTENGYGQIRIDYVNYLCHRISAMIHLGLDIRDKTQQANHKSECSNRNCWNPDHLYIGTSADNTRDRIQAVIDYCMHNNDPRYCRRCAKKQVSKE